MEKESQYSGVPGKKMSVNSKMMSERQSNKQVELLQKKLKQVEE